VHYKAAVDKNMVPVADVPLQDIRPWQKVVERLATDRDHYQELARTARQAALNYARDLNVLPFEAFLEELIARPKKAQPSAPQPALDRLSVDKKKLLALRLRQKASHTERSPWFTGLEEHQPGRNLLFCFPFAGGGTLLYKSWRETLSAVATVCAVRLPGRESRLEEKPIDDLAALVDVLGHQIVPYLHKPFSFFGHSMGAAIAFELARWLRAHGYALPSALHVSAARAPQFRLRHEPKAEPSFEAFIDELRRLEGVAPEILASEQLMALALPSLRADARLYRNYVYQPGPKFGFPIFAYGGTDDPNIEAHHLEAWKEQTGAGFKMQQFRGGHFYLQNSPEFLHTLAAELGPSTL
jgi:medium-chain acyl-[acyl-carrier-protein] hydrolase